MTLAVIGLGFVGLPFALVAAKSGQKVIGVEADKKPRVFDTRRIINPEKMLTVDYFALGYGN